MRPIHLCAHERKYLSLANEHKGVEARISIECGNNGKRVCPSASTQDVADEYDTLSQDIFEVQREELEWMLSVLVDVCHDLT